MKGRTSASRSNTQPQERFSHIPGPNVQRSKFNRSCGLKTTFDSGYLVPIFVDEALPGDTFSLKQTLLGRLATPIQPIMENMWLDTQYFFVPNRLIWDNWEKMNGSQDDPGDSTDFLVPQVVSPSAGGFNEGSLHDYLGLPINVPDMSCSALWHRAGNLIWNEWYRDENLQDSLQVPKDDGPDAIGGYRLQRRGKRKDYFTSCLPWPQKGPAVELPLGLRAPVIGIQGVAPEFESFSPLQKGPLVTATVGGGVSASYGSGSGTGADLELRWDPAGVTGLETDLSSATAATINQLREAFQIQRMYEKDARGGTRYTEVLRAHFGVVSPDQRLQRPEYLGGSSARIMIHPVQQTSESATTPQGNLSAFGVVVETGHVFSKSFVEHGVIIGYASVRADLNYQQGLDRMFSRRDRFDFYWPTLAHLGEQAVLNKEIYAQGSVDPIADEAVFGYQERFAEYRYKPSRITGAMRSAAAQSLDTWHLAQDFAALPLLNATFIEENPPVDRIIAVPTEPQFLLDGFFDYQCARPMPVYSVPGLIDHF